MRLAFSLSAAAVAVLAFAPAAAANNDFLMGFLLGLENEIGSPFQCIADATSISSTCKDAHQDQQSGSACMDALHKLVQDCGLEQVTVGRIKALATSPISYWEARANLLLGNSDLRDALDQAKTLCKDETEQSSCGVNVGKFLGLLIAVPADAATTPVKDHKWLVYVALWVGAAVLATAVWCLVKSTLRFVSDIARPLLKLVLILVLWVVFILVVARVNFLHSAADNVVQATAADAQQLVADMAAPLIR